MTEFDVLPSGFVEFDVVPNTPKIVEIYIPQGAPGTPGPKGDPGATGPKGDTGATGADGAQGVQGIQGIPGAQGIPGPDGAQGAPGGAFVRAKWQYNVNPSPPPPTGQIRTDATNTAVYVNNIDDDGFTRIQGLSQLAINDLIQFRGADGSLSVVRINAAPIDHTTWWEYPVVVEGGDPAPNKGTKVEVSLVVGAPAGPQGIPGPQGPAGNVGPQGVPGTNGTNGATGPAGAQGPAGPSKGIAVNLDGDTELFGNWTIVDDGTDTATWPNRGGMSFKPLSGEQVQTFQWNEYGEVRVIPAKTNTVGFRVFARQFTTSAAHSNSVAVLEVMNNRDDRVTMFGVFPDGRVSALNVDRRVTTWPTGSEPSLSGVPDGTLWVEYTP